MDRPNISQLAREHSLEPRLVHNRLHKGWTLDKALNTPIEKKASILQLAKQFNQRPSTVYARLERGWTIDEALIQPPDKQSRR